MLLLKWTNVAISKRFVSQLNCFWGSCWFLEFLLVFVVIVWVFFHYVVTFPNRLFTEHSLLSSYHTLWSKICRLKIINSKLRSSLLWVTIINFSYFFDNCFLEISIQFYSTFKLNLFFFISYLNGKGTFLQII